MTELDNKPICRIEYYATNIGYFFKIKNLIPYSGSDGYSINGIEVKNLPSTSGWLYSDKEIKNIKRKKSAERIHTGYRLINATLQSSKIPSFIPLQEIEVERDEEYNVVWKGAYLGLQSLYEPTYDLIPEESVQIDDKVEFVKIRDLHIENYSQPSKMTVKLFNSNYFSPQIQSVDLSDIVQFSDLDKMLTPEFLLHERPCELSSEQVYKIIRHHVKENINRKHALVYSDYDFCFSVDKITQTKPYEVKVEKLTRSGNSYKPPRFEPTLKSNKNNTIFKMTHAGYKAGDGSRGYKGYPCIEPWKADNLQELYDNMKKYLEDLMQVINAPAVECEHCNGTGSVFSL